VEQHGGSHTPLQGAPVGYTGELDLSLRGSAGVLQQDANYAAAAAQSALSLKPQAGGRRKSRKGKSRKGKSRKGKGSKSRRQSGGCGTEHASTTQPGMLLTDDLYSKAGLPSFNMLA